VLNKLSQNGSCGIEGGTSCESYCTCEIAQFSGEALANCQQTKTPSQPGYCYVNFTEGEQQVPEQGGNPALVAECPADSKRLLNFGAETPRSGAIALVACLGASLGSTATQ
jgi:hypothetical protein